MHIKRLHDPGVLNADICGYVLQFLEFPEQIAFSFMIGRFDEDILKRVYNPEYFLHGYFYEKNLFESPFLRRFLNSKHMHKCKSHSTCDCKNKMNAYLLVYQIMCKCIKPMKGGAFLIGSWALKLYEIRSGIFDNWIPNDIDISIEEKNQEITYGKIIKLTKCLTGVSDLTNDSYIDTINTTSIIRFNLRSSTLTNIDVVAFDTAKNCKLTILNNTNFSITQLCIDNYAMYVKYPEDIKFRKFKYQYVGMNIISDKKKELIQQKLWKYINRGFALYKISSIWLVGAKNRIISGDEYLKAMCTEYS